MSNTKYTTDNSKEAYQFYFEKMHVWKDSAAFVKRIYNLTSVFPDAEKFGLISQLRRAAVSIPTNIAEGSGRNTDKDQAYFTGVAYSSLLEVHNLLIISFQLNLIDEVALSEIRIEAVMIANKLTALRNAQVRRARKNG